MLLPRYALTSIVPDIAADAWTAPGCIIIGNVELAAEASVWFGAVIRGDNERIVVGRRSNVQDGAVLHTDPGFPLHIGSDCTIGHQAMLHGCTIGDGSLIGIGAVVLNGARIGKGCLIGAKALIPEGREIPDGSLVMGLPGKVVRSLTLAEIDGLRASAAHYVANAARFRAGLLVTP
jgi:carbonic anhydrase/acetyltransferase-like protein (isoleucine patch superfamily)